MSDYDKARDEVAAIPPERIAADASLRLLHAIALPALVLAESADKAAHCPICDSYRFNEPRTHEEGCTLAAFNAALRRALEGNDVG